MKFKRCLNFIFPVVDIYVIIPSAYRTEGRDATERSLAVIVMTTLLFLFADHRVHHRLVSECLFFCLAACGWKRMEKLMSLKPLLYIEARVFVNSSLEQSIWLWFAP